MTAKESINIRIQPANGLRHKNKGGKEKPAASAIAGITIEKMVIFSGEHSIIKWGFLFHHPFPSMQ